MLGSVARHGTWWSSKQRTGWEAAADQQYSLLSLPPDASCRSSGAHFSPHTCHTDAPSAISPLMEPSSMAITWPPIAWPRCWHCTAATKPVRRQASSGGRPAFSWSLSCNRTAT
jgi:hypothetical protein